MGYNSRFSDLAGIPVPTPAAPVQLDTGGVSLLEGDTIEVGMKCGASFVHMTDTEHPMMGFGIRGTADHPFEDCVRSEHDAEPLEVFMRGARAAKVMSINFTVPGFRVPSTVAGVSVSTRPAIHYRMHYRLLKSGVYACSVGTEDDYPDFGTYTPGSSLMSVLADLVEAADDEIASRFMECRDPRHGKNWTASTAEICKVFMKSTRMWNTWVAVHNGRCPICWAPPSVQSRLSVLVPSVKIGDVPVLGMVEKPSELASKLVPNPAALDKPGPRGVLTAAAIEAKKAELQKLREAQNAGSSGTIPSVKMEFTNPDPTEAKKIVERQLAASKLKPGQVHVGRDGEIIDHTGKVIGVSHDVKRAHLGRKVDLSTVEPADLTDVASSTMGDMSTGPAYKGKPGEAHPQSWAGMQAAKEEAAKARAANLRAKRAAKKSGDVPPL